MMISHDFEYLEHHARSCIHRIPVLSSLHLKRVPQTTNKLERMHKLDFIKEWHKIAFLCWRAVKHKQTNKRQNARFNSAL